MTKLPPFDKYQYYFRSVQSPEDDIDFMEQAYLEARSKRPVVLREDFCGTYANCCEWVRRGPERRAIGIDLDNEPLSYGTEHHLSQLNAEQKKQVEIREADVMADGLPKADVIAALNFSYFGFKRRAVLKDYFARCLAALNTDGILVLDCFGGPACHEPNEHETEYEDFSYFWDQDSFNPVTNEATFYIHFERKGEAKREKVFTYDWRLWTIPELKDMLLEAGFKDVHVYWEGTDEEGDGDGHFERTEQGEICESFLAYLVAIK